MPKSDDIFRAAVAVADITPPIGTPLAGTCTLVKARRILDRLVGYSVSPLLWKKVKRGLSAGRVQTAALRIVVEREKEINAFDPVEYWSLDAELSKITGKALKKNETFKSAIHRIDGKKAELSTGEQTQAVVDRLDGAGYQVVNVTKRESQRRPSAPSPRSRYRRPSPRRCALEHR